MEVVSLGPLPVASLLWQPRPGAWMFTFVCKATYSLRPGESPLAAEQQPLNKADRYWHDNPANSLMAPCDITPLRPRTDVVLVGSAFAPGGVPVRSLVAHLAVADIDKRIEVYCDRLQNRNGAVQEGPPFSQMSLAYERAAGGPDSMNPVGMRPDSWDANVNRKLPNVQAPGSQRQGTMNRAEVDGFGPIAPSWPSRRYRLGHHAASWSDATWHRQPLPDFDRSYFNAAPSDQQTQKLEDNARITLENLHPEHAQLVTSLPGIHPHAFIRRPDRLPESAQIGIDLLWIHTDKAICTLTWRGQVPLENAQDDGVILVAVENPGERLTWEDVARLMSRGASVVGGGARFGGVGETVAPPVVTSAAPAVNPLKGTLAAPTNAAPSGNVTPFTKQPGDGAPSGQPADPAQRLAATPFARPGEPPQNLESSGSWNISPPSPAPTEAPFARTESPPAAAPPMPPPSFGAPPPSFGIPVSSISSDSPWARGSAGAPPGGDSLSPAPAAPFVQQVQAAMGGAAAASDAAIDPWINRPPVAEPPEKTPPQKEAAAEPARAEAVELLWYDPKALPRIRRHWSELIVELDFEANDDRYDLPTEDTDEAKDWHHVFGILTEGEATPPEAIGQVIEKAISPKGRLRPPLVLLDGEISFCFDELEVLKATLAILLPMAGGDAKLKALLGELNEVASSQYLSGATALLKKLTQQTRDQFSQSNKSVPLSQVTSQVEQILLHQRKYEICKVLGGEYIKALLPVQKGPAITVFLPKPLSNSLPLTSSVHVRLLGSANTSEIGFGYAVNSVALARILSRELFP